MAGAENTQQNVDEFMRCQIVGVGCINATCVRADPLPFRCPYASSIHCCIGHSNDTHAGPDLISGGGDCSCMLLLHPAPTCSDAGPDLCILHWCSFASINWCKYSTCTVWWYPYVYTTTQCKLQYVPIRLCAH